MSAAAPYLRVTVLGGRRPADFVLPTNHPTALLVPQILDVVGTADGTAAYELATPEGRVLPADAELAAAGLRDGVQLRLVEAAQAPPPPIVYDMVEVVDHVVPRGVWSAVSRRWVLSLLAAVTWVVVAWIAAAGHPAEAVRLWWAAAAIGVVVSLGAAALERPEAAWSFGAAAVLLVASGLAGDARNAWWWSAVLALAVLVAGWCRRRLVAPAATLGTGALLGGLGYVLTRALPDKAAAAAVVAIAALFIVGILPRAALAAAGVFRLDVEVGAGRRLPRRDALARVAEAHAALAGGLLVAALGLGIALTVLAMTRPGVWTTGLTAVLVLAVALRARHFPLALERGALWLAAMVGIVGLVRSGLHAAPRIEPLVVLGAAALVGLLLLAAYTRLSDLRAAQLRRGAAVVETAAMLATVPVAVGVFGVYGDLLATFC